MHRPRIKRTIEEIETPEGDIYLLRFSGESAIRIEQPDEEERRLLAAFEGSRTLEQLRYFSDIGRVGARAMSQRIGHRWIRFARSPENTFEKALQPWA